MLKCCFSYSVECFLNFKKKKLFENVKNIILELPCCFLVKDITRTQIDVYSVWNAGRLSGSTSVSNTYRKRDMHFDFRPLTSWALATHWNNDRKTKRGRDTHATHTQRKHSTPNPEWPVEPQLRTKGPPIKTHPHHKRSYTNLDINR